jgi:hypothetical protein
MTHVFLAAVAGDLAIRDPELQSWGEPVRQQAWRDASLSFHHEEEGKGPQMAKRFLQLAV